MCFIRTYIDRSRRSTLHNSSNLNSPNDPKVKLLIFPSYVRDRYQFIARIIGYAVSSINDFFITSLRARNLTVCKYVPYPGFLDAGDATVASRRVNIVLFSN